MWLVYFSSSKFIFPNAKEQLNLFLIPLCNFGLSHKHGYWIYKWILKVKLIIFIKFIIMLLQWKKIMIYRPKTLDNEATQKSGFSANIALENFPSGLCHTFKLQAWTVTLTQYCCLMDSTTIIFYNYILKNNFLAFFHNFINRTITTSIINNHSLYIIFT